MHNNPGESYMDYIAWQQYQASCGTSNYASVETLKYMLPIIMERELTEQQRQCMQLHYFAHKNQTEIAGQLGITQSTVSRILKTARKRMEKYLRYSLMAADKTSALLH